MSTADSPAPLKRTSTIVTIVATVVGTVLAYLSLAAAVKWPPFAPEPTVSVFRGGQVADARCNVAACAFIAVKLEGFVPGSTVRCEFDSSQGADSFEPLVAVVDDDGDHNAVTKNFYGTPGGWVSVTCADATGTISPW